jgi:pyridoxamine 5'-phosphate oxidase
MKDQISNSRSNYSGDSLDKKTVLSDPNEQFKVWFKDALNGGVAEPNAMTLATCNKEAVPSVRIVLLKDYNEKGLTFYTSYYSRKGKELDENPHASLLFFWPELFRQVRIDGIVSKVEPSVSEIYFKERPRGSQIAAWISAQSTEIENREILESKYAGFEKEHMDKEIPYPSFWGGYCLKPASFEFWQGQENRLHDRILYCLDPHAGNRWLIKRLSP